MNSQSAPTADRTLRWPAKVLAGDYVRGLLGIVVTLLCAALAPWGSWWQLGLLALLALFIMFLIDVLVRHGTRFVLSAEGLVRIRPLLGRTTIPWSQIEGLEVRFYATDRSRKKGWLTAKIKNPKDRITVDEGLDGFEDILERAYQALDRRGLGVDPVTSGNLASLGFGLKPRARR